MHFEEKVKSEKWRVAMDFKMEAIEKNDTWFLTDLTVRVKRSGVKWVYKIRLDEARKLYKDHLVAKGYK